MIQLVCLDSNTIREPDHPNEGQAKEEREWIHEERGGINRNCQVQAELGLEILRANRKQATPDVMLTEPS